MALRQRGQRQRYDSVGGAGDDSAMAARAATAHGRPPGGVAARTARAKKYSIKQGSPYQSISVYQAQLGMGEEIARERRATSDSRFFFSLFFFSLFFFLPPSADTARNRPVTVEIDRYRSISDGNKVKTATIGDTA
ncbi:hypothetical protein BHE74_00011332 [Ensete ventricosum]|nr:hypothetical protein BHE74_00011332 [Ensete ventricosum]